MNIQTSLRMDKAVFATWVEGEPERYELAGGLAMMMPRPSLAHGLIVSNMMFALRRRLDPKQWAVVAEFGLDTAPDTLRYPDIVVDRAGGSAKSYTAQAAVLLAEVLSPSSAETDLGDKPIEYLQLPSLLAYVVLSQSEPKAYVYARKDAGFDGCPAVLSGAAAVIAVPALGLELPLAEIYDGVPLELP